MAKNGTLMVDGVDIAKRYGIHVSDGGLASLICWPPLKEVESNDWFEEEGLEEDLSAPSLSSRDIDLQLSLTSGNDFDGFMDMLRSRTYHDVRSEDLGMDYRLRYVSCGDLNTADGDVGLTSVKMSDDFPLWNFSRSGLVATGVKPSGIDIDGRDLSAYGVVALQGTIDQFRSLAEAKTPLARDLSSRDGLITDGVTTGGLSTETAGAYDNPPIKRRSGIVELRCLMRDMTAPEFGKNWNTLLYDLTMPESRVVTVTPIGRSFRCRYDSCTVSRFYSATVGLWCEFSINLAIIGY